MSKQPDQYILLMSSLPAPERLFAAKQPPLSRLRLEQRLRVLTDADSNTLQLIENALSWDTLSMADSERDVIERGKQVLSQVKSTRLQKIVRDRLELRTCVAALRRRARGEKTAPNQPWGFGRWLHHIARNWSDPGFRLEHVFPWVIEADQMIQRGDANALERMLLEQSYRQLQRTTGIHVFDMEAVVIYVLKWNIVDRVARYNTESASRRFQHLMQASLGEYENMVFSKTSDGER